MKSTNRFRTLLPVMLLAGIGLALPAAGQAKSIAIANPSNILQQMQETKDKNAAEANERGNLDTQEKGKVNELQDMKKIRDTKLLKGSPEYVRSTNEMMAKSIEYQTWVEIKKAELARRHKEEIKALFDKIELAIAAIAKEKKIDLVIADYGADFPEDLDNITPDQLHALIRQKSILYAADGVDISSAVTARLDADYKNKK